MIIYTYLLEANGLYKVGKTINIKNRLSNLKTGNPDIKLIALIDIDIEKELHLILKPFNYSKEWFSLKDKNEVIDYFIDRKINS